MDIATNQRSKIVFVKIMYVAWLIPHTSAFGQRIGYKVIHPIELYGNIANNLDALER